MTEDHTESTLQQISHDVKGLVSTDIIKAAMIFFNEARVGNPFLKFMLERSGTGYVIHPIVKLKLRSFETGMTRTVLLGSAYESVFCQIVQSFGSGRQLASSTISCLETHLGRRLYEQKETMISGMYNSYIKSDRFNNEYLLGKTKNQDILRKRMITQLMENFRVIQALGETEGSMINLFRGVEIERVLGS